MRIAFVICNIGFGHATRSLNIIHELEKRGHEIHVLIGKPYDSFFRERGYKTHTITEPIDLYKGVGESIRKTIKFSMESFPKSLKTFLMARKIIKRIDPDALVSDSEPATIISVRNIKKVIITHQPNVQMVTFSKADYVWGKILEKCDKVLVPDVIGVKIPENLQENAEKIGPLFEEIDEDMDEIRKDIGVDDGFGLVIPSFAHKNKSEAIDEVSGLDCDFIFLGQDKNEKIENVALKKREDVKTPCKYIKAANFVILSGYTSLMEAVYYQKPVLMIPTQMEQRKIAEKGQENGLLKVGKFRRDDIKSFIENRDGWEEMVKKQRKYHKSGVKEAAEIIEKLE